MVAGACDDAALLVLPARSRWWRHGPAAARVLRRTRCAVAVAGGAATARGAQVVVGVDAAGGAVSAATRTALATAAGLAAELDAGRGVRVVAAGLGPVARTGITAALQAAAPGCRTEVVGAGRAVAAELLRARGAAALVVPRSLLGGSWGRRALLRRVDVPVVLVL